MLRWEDYPTISKIEGEEVFLERPGRKELIETIESLEEDEYLVVGEPLLPYNPKFSRRYGSAEFMKWGPELKVRVVDEPARFHIERELKRYSFTRPKRGFKWTNPKNRTSVFIPLTNLIDGAKLFSYSKHGEIDEIDLGELRKSTWARVPSRTRKEKHKVIFNPIPESERKWYEFQGFCDCGEKFYYGHASRKYVNPESYVCAHIIAGYYELEEVKYAPKLFPVPKKKVMEFDEKLARTFVKEKYKRRLKKGEREFVHSLYQGLCKDNFSYEVKPI